MKQLKNFLDEEGRLVKFPAKRAMQLEALGYLAEKFQPDRTYTEREVNQLLDQWHCFQDPATLRRALFDHRFLDRDPYGTSYKRTARETAAEPEQLS